MQTKSKIALAGAIALSSAALWGFAKSAHAEVAVLTIQSFNSTTGEVSLTNNRGVITLNLASLSGPFNTGASGSIATNNSGPVDIPSDPGGAAINTGMSGGTYYTASGLTISGFSNNAPITLPNIEFIAFDQTAMGLTPVGTSPFISSARGFLEGDMGSPFPADFSFSPQGSSPTAPTSLTPTPTLTPSSLNVPELNTARLTLPEPTTQPDHPAAQNNPAANTAPGGQNLRPNGIHTRIIPEWSPGLYQ